MDLTRASEQEIKDDILAFILDDIREAVGVPNAHFQEEKKKKPSTDMDKPRRKRQKIKYTIIIPVKKEQTPVMQPGFNMRYEGLSEPVNGHGVGRLLLGPKTRTSRKGSRYNIIPIPDDPDNPDGPVHFRTVSSMGENVSSTWLYPSRPDYATLNSEASSKTTAQVLERLNKLLGG